MNKSQIASHRGGTLVWGENSRRAFEHTLRLSVELVEFDVHPTRDGIVVVHHDATLDRTTDMSGPVNAKTWQQISQGSVNFSGGQRMMTLEELCELYQGSDIVLRVEIKADINKVPYCGLVDEVLSIVEKTAMEKQTIISSFNCEVLSELATKKPELTTIWLVQQDMPQLLGCGYMVKLARLMSVDEISVHVSKLNAEHQDMVTINGFKYGCYGAHNADLIQTALEFGVHAFTTDRPDLAIKLRDNFMLEKAS